MKSSKLNSTGGWSYTHHTLKHPSKLYIYVEVHTLILTSPSDSSLPITSSAIPRHMFMVFTAMPSTQPRTLISAFIEDTVSLQNNSHTVRGEEVDRVYKIQSSAIYTPV